MSCGQENSKHEEIENSDRTGGYLNCCLKYKAKLLLISQIQNLVFQQENQRTWDA